MYWKLSRPRNTLSIVMSTATALNLSVVVPAPGESGNLLDLIKEIVTALA